MADVVRLLDQPRARRQYGLPEYEDERIPIWENVQDPVEKLGSNNTAGHSRYSARPLRAESQETTQQESGS